MPVYYGDDDQGRAKYAGVNAIRDAGAYGGRKSAAYLDLFRAVREAARAEMARTGWETWHGTVQFQVVRYHRTRRLVDAPNMGVVEANALRPSTPEEERRDRCDPFPGVYRDDVPARPHSADCAYDPDGTDRVLIICRRRYPDVLPVHAPPPRPPKATPPAVPRPAAREERRSGVYPPKPPATPPGLASYRAGDPIPDGYVLENGVLVKMTAQEALDRIFGQGSRREDGEPPRVHARRD